MFHAVIMAGGTGTRFWPASRAARPKQLIRLSGERTLIQATVERLEGVVPRENIWIVTSRSHAAALSAQVPEVPAENVIIEPCGRNTAPCTALAALHIAWRDPAAEMICMPADHVVSDAQAWRDLLLAASALLKTPGRILVFGIPPTRPETGFGYVRFGPQIEECNGIPVHEVEGFTEKPELDRARALIEAGNCYWNSGLAAWSAETFLDAVRTHLPELSRGLEPVRPVIGTDSYDEVLTRVYPDLPSVSLDYGILEKVPSILGLPASMGWSDVGSWSALPEVLQAHEDSSVSLGDSLRQDSSGCVIYSPDHLVATVGVQDLIIVATDDAVLVCHKDRAQDVKKVVEELRRRGRTDLL